MKLDSKINNKYKINVTKLTLGVSQIPEAVSEGRIQGFNIDIQGKEINGANPDVQKAMMIQRVAC